MYKNPKLTNNIVFYLEEVYICLDSDYDYKNRKSYIFSKNILKTE